MTQKSINKKIAELNESVDWFYGEEFELEKATDKYEATLKLANEIEKDLTELENKITVIDKNFATEE